VGMRLWVCLSEEEPGPGASMRRWVCLSEEEPGPGAGMRLWVCLSVRRILGLAQV